MRNALGERGMWRGYRPPSRLAGLVEYRSYPSGVQGGASENDFGAFLPEKPPLVNRILLNVAECCVIELLTSK